MDAILSASLFQPLEFRKNRKYRALSHYSFSDDEIMLLCVALNDRLITPQMRGRLIKTLAKRHCLSRAMINCWFCSFINNTPFIHHLPEHVRVPIPQFPLKKTFVR